MTSQKKLGNESHGCLGKVCVCVNKGIDELEIIFEQRRDVDYFTTAKNETSVKMHLLWIYQVNRTKS